MKSTAWRWSAGRPSEAVEAQTLVRRHRRSVDPGADPAGGDGSVRALHTVQHPEETHDREGVPQNSQQRQVSLHPHPCSHPHLTSVIALDM